MSRRNNEFYTRQYSINESHAELWDDHWVEFAYEQKTLFNLRPQLVM